jgi:DNA-binding CsgD family transcriptional regulator/tetratricopeptide (TPR) repeat protein
MLDVTGPAAPSRAHVDTAAQCRDLLDQASARFVEGEIGSSAELALTAGELAKSADRMDLLVEAALVVAGVPDPTTAAVVERLCDEALARMDANAPATEARLHGQLAIALHHRERLDEAEEHVRRAEQLAQQTEDPLAAAAALHGRQLAIAGLGRTDELLALGDRMLQAARAADSVDAELLGRSWRIDALMRGGETSAAGHEIDSLDVLATRSRRPLVRWNALLARAGLCQAVGRFDEAVQLAQQARRSLPPSQRQMTQPLFVAQLMLVAIDRGSEPEDIELARGQAIGAPLLAVAMTGRYDLEVGDEVRARMSYEAVRSRLPEVMMDRRGLPTLTAVLELAVHFEDPEVASALHARLQPFDGLMIASALGAVGPVGYFLGRVEGLLGDQGAALWHFGESVELAVRGGYGPWLARARLAHAKAGLTRRAPGDRERARQSASLAVAGARQLGMERVRLQAQRILDDLGGVGRLTPREREIAGRVAAGATNRDIAASLVLSDRTVETHVQNILTKLGFHTRSQIAAWAVSEGVTGASRT